MNHLAANWIAVLALVLLPGPLTGCLEDCGRCVRDHVEITVHTPGGAADVRVTGSSPFSCNETTIPEVWMCSSYSLPYGDHSLVIQAAGFADQTLDITLEDQHIVGCGCLEPYEADVVLISSGGDAGVQDAGR